MQYDSITGNLLNMSNPENNISRYTYNTRGQVLEATNPIGNKTKFEYNAAGDLIKTTDPLTNAVNATVDAAGRSTTITDPLGFATAIQYNNINQPTKLTDALLGETKLAYNAKHQLQSVTDANSHVVESYQYDDMFRVTSRTDNTGATDTYQYDPIGQLRQATDRKGQIISQTYDEQDRPVNTSYADGTILTRLYDAVGRLSRLTRGAEAISYTYDLVDRVTSMVVTANGKTDTLVYTYDNLNRLTQRSVNNVITAYTYDNAKRIRTITHQGQTTTYNWDAASRLTSKVLPNGVTQSMQYDNANRMTQMTYRKTDNSIIEQISYTFDARGQRTSKSTTNAYPAAEESAYSGVYDNANRLTQVTTKGTGVNNTDETFNLRYDINGNMTEKKKVDNSDTTSYTWDSQNRLVGLTRTGATTLTASFKYDMGNRRIEKTINGVTVKFIYDGDQIVGEQKAGDTTTSVLAGLAIDEMIARYSNGQQSTYLTDALGSVIAQLKDDQSVQNQYGYSPYGVTVKGNAGVVDAAVDDKGNASQYTGRENDGTGLYYYRARYYMAGCGRFISEDPIGLAGQQTNLYAYVGGDPVGLTDPIGLWSITFGGYSGAGGEVTFGRDPNTCQGFMSGKFGFGVGGGAKWDPRGGRPGSDADSPIRASGITYGLFADVEFNAGPGQAALQNSVGREPKPYADFMKPNVTIGDSWGFRAVGSAGGEVSVYTASPSGATCR